MKTVFPQIESKFYLSKQKGKDQNFGQLQLDVSVTLRI